MVQVKVSEGILEGEEVVNEYGGSFYSFKGVPYAQPPLGDLRFMAPLPPQPWQGVRSAKEIGPRCYQYDVFLKTPPSGSEDCLYLNVYTPNIKPKQPLPVMFWIHGGGFTSGSGDPEIYGPEFLVRKDVILVTFNYRLEILGFLCLDTEDIPGNAGMKDQVAALRWVKKNIRSFGGDPENITIFGESAGGCSVTYHLISPMTKGLFKRAISQSGSANSYWGTAIEPRERAKALARKLGVDSDDDKELYEFFKAQPVESLVNANVPMTITEENDPVINVSYSIVSEKEFGNNERFFYGDVYDSLRNGIHEGVEVIAGYCVDEGILALALIEDEEKVFAQINKYTDLFAPKEIALNCPLVSHFDAGRIFKKFYLNGKKLSSETLDQWCKFVGMSMFIFNLIQWQKISSAKNKTYLYEFTCKSERNWMKYAMNLAEKLGQKTVTSHADDLGYLFPLNFLQQKVSKDSEAFKLIDNVTTLWTNFAKYGNPTPDSSLGVQWKPFTCRDQDYLEIGNQLIPSTKPCEEELLLWEKVFKRHLPHHVA